MNNASQSPSGSTAWVDQIPVLWFEPHIRGPERRLIIFLGNFSGAKENTTSFLQDIAAAGFVALSFDPWQHGERGTESRDQILARVFGNFRRHMWPIIGHTALDTLRVIDWAVAALDVRPAVFMCGLSMGGDIAVAAAGLDHRITRIAPVVATPDWLRPGMHDAFNPEILLSPGEPDAYAQYFYDQLNPLTHLDAYQHGPNIRFVCGEKDTHVPPDGALRFKALLQETYPSVADRIEVGLVPGMAHLDVRSSGLWWPDCLSWLKKGRG